MKVHACNGGALAAWAAPKLPLLVRVAVRSTKSRENAQDSLQESARSAPKERGVAVVEAALWAPWLIFMFIGVLDFGFYNYAAIATENAARVGALSYSAGPGRTWNHTCQLVIQEMQTLPNVNASSWCATTPAGISAALPIALSVTQLTGPDGRPAVQVRVDYRTLPMPLIVSHEGGLLTGGAMTCSRTLQLRLDES